MADTKNSGLEELVAVPADDDLFYMVDVSDTSMAGTGTSKKNKAKYVLRTNGTANTLGANINANGFNFTGAGTVGAGAILAANYYGGTASGGSVVIDSTAHAIKGMIIIQPSGGSVGIGTAPPSYKLDVSGSFQCTVLGGSWTALPLNTGGNWADVGGGQQVAQYKKIGDLVFLRGYVRRTSGSNDTIATLPLGYRPLTAFSNFITSGNDAYARITIASDGTIVINYGSGSSFLILNNIWFSTT